MSNEEIALKLTCAMLEAMGRAGCATNNAYVVADNYKTIIKKLEEKEE